MWHSPASPVHCVMIPEKNPSLLLRHRDTGRYNLLVLNVSGARRLG